MAAEDGLKAQKLLAQGVWDVAYDTPSFFSIIVLSFWNLVLFVNSNKFYSFLFGSLQKSS